MDCINSTYPFYCFHLISHQPIYINITKILSIQPPSDIGKKMSNNKGCFVLLEDGVQYHVLENIDKTLKVISGKNEIKPA